MWKIGGVWNYTATIPATETIIGGESVVFSARESGSLNMKMATGPIADREYFDSASMDYSGRYTISAGGQSQSDTYSGKDSKFNFDKVLYTPGEDITWYVSISSQGITAKERLICKQVSENRVEGELILYINEQEVARGPVQATRPSPDSGSGGGGCNAGFGILAMLLAMPVIFRKKD